MGTVMMWISINFPARLTHLRKDLGHSQQRFAEAVGLHVNQVKRTRPERHSRRWRPW